MLYRKIISKLERYFLSHSNKILIIDGARQVGKSFIIRHVGQRMFSNYIEINMEKDKLKDRLFANVRTVEEFMFALSSVAGKKMKFYPGFEKGSSKKTDYYAYMAKNTYWFCCWGALGFYQEDYTTLPYSALRNRYYALVPEGFETFRDDYTVTHDPDKFWE